MFAPVINQKKSKNYHLASPVERLTQDAEEEHRRKRDAALNIAERTGGIAPVIKPGVHPQVNQAQTIKPMIAPRLTVNDPPEIQTLGGVQPDEAMNERFRTGVGMQPTQPLTPKIAQRADLPIADQIAQQPIKTQKTLDDSMAELPRSMIAPRNENSKIVPQLSNDYIPESETDFDGYDVKAEADKFFNSQNKIAPRSPLDDAYEKRKRIAQEGAEPEHSLWKRLLQGALRGMTTGGVTGAIVGAGVEGFVPSMNRKMRTLGELAKANQEVAVLESETKARREAEEAAIKNQTAIVNLNQSQLNLMRTANEELWKSITADKRITSEEAEIAKQHGFNVVPYDARGFVEIDRNGKRLIRPEFSPEYEVNPTVPVDPTEVPGKYNIYGSELPLTPKQVAPVIASAGAADLQRQQDAAKFNVSQQVEAQKFNATKAFEAQKENLSNAIRYNEQAIKQALELAKATGEADAMYASIEGIGKQMQLIEQEYQSIQLIENPATEAEVKANQHAAERKNRLMDRWNRLNGEMWDKAGKFKAGKTVIEQLQKSQPQKPGAIIAPKINPVSIQPAQANLGKKTATKADVEAYAKGRGISYEEAKKAAEADGYIIQSEQRNEIAPKSKGKKIYSMADIERVIRQ